MSRVTPVYRTEDEVRDEAKLILGFDKIEDGIKQGMVLVYKSGHKKLNDL